MEMIQGQLMYVAASFVEGIFLMFFQWGLLVLSVAAMVMFHLQIVEVEEFFLLQTFGKDYMDYKRKVLRYFGRNLR